jgi:hypothetical protein
VLKRLAPGERDRVARSLDGDSDGQALFDTERDEAARESVHLGGEPCRFLRRRVADWHAVAADTFELHTGARVRDEEGDVDAVFRALPVVVLPGYSRPLVRVSDYLELIEQSTYAGDRVR